MSFRIPTADHPARAYLGDMAYVAEVLNPANLERLPTLPAALRNCRDLMAGGPHLPCAVTSICLDESTDERMLIRVGPRGGWRKLWSFGTGRD